MTLTVAINLPDGIVLASDSLITINAEERGIIPVNNKCPGCGTEMPLNIPIAKRDSFTGSIYSQKIFNLKGNKGVLLDGSAFINNRTIESHIREFDAKYNQDNLTTTETADRLINHLKSILPVGESTGFQLAGFDEGFTGKIVSCNVNQAPEKNITDIFNVSLRGYALVINKLWSPLVDTATNLPVPEPRPDFRFMTIQDGIDYAIFLLRTTIEYQRFAVMYKTVGGSIDIAIITPHAGFEWIQKKELKDEKGISQLRKEHVNSRILKQIADSLILEKQKEPSVKIIERKAV